MGVPNLAASEFLRQPDGRRFHVRKLCEEYQVYAGELCHIALCPTEPHARMVAAALEYSGAVEDAEEDSDAPGAMDDGPENMRD